MNSRLLISVLIGFLPVFCNEEQTTSVTGIPAPASHDCSFAELDSLSLTAIYDGNGAKIPDTSANSDSVAWTIINPRDQPSFNGLGRYSDCSGTLIDTKGTDTKAPAYVLTNGHCVGSSLLEPSAVVINKSEAAGKNMFPSYYVENVRSKNLKAYPAQSIAFASMNGTDVGLVALSTSLAALKSLGYCSYPLAHTRPSEGTEIFIGGVPMSGINASLLGLHYAHCTMGKTVSVWEGDYRFLDSFRHRCSILGGNSGSAIFDRHSKEIVGVVNTTVNDSADGQAACSLNHPCEKSTNGTTSTDYLDNYGQYIDFLAACFTPEGYFDATLDSCGIKEKFGE